MICPINSYFDIDPSLIKHWTGASVWQRWNSEEVRFPAENVTHTLGEGYLLGSKGPRGFLGQIQFPDPQILEAVLAVHVEWSGLMACAPTAMAD